MDAPILLYANEKGFLMDSETVVEFMVHRLRCDLCKVQFETTEEAAEPHMSHKESISMLVTSLDFPAALPFWVSVQHFNTRDDHSGS